MARAGNWRLRTGNSKAQGATEYLLILGVLGLIAVVASSLLGYLPGTAVDARKETYLAQLRAGEPFSIEDHNARSGKLSISFANKRGNELNLTDILLSSGNITLTESTGGLSAFSGGMRRVLTVDVPCSDSTKEFEVTLLYIEDGVRKEEKMDGKIIVDKCTGGSANSLPGDECSTDADCAQGTCDAGVCKIDVGVCYSDDECESGNCDPFTHFCDSRLKGACSPSCSIEDAGTACSETLADCPGWESDNPQCGVSADCAGRYADCSLLCGGVCAGNAESCGGGMPCCGGYLCLDGACAPEGGVLPCAGIGGECSGTPNCCENTYCSSNVSGSCLACETSGSCTSTSQCCNSYVCGQGYISMDKPRAGNECGLPDGSDCSADSQCLNGTCYADACKNCNTGNTCNPANGNADCCNGNACSQNQTGQYVCQSALTVSGNYTYLYDPTWNMNGNWAVIYKVYSNGTRVNARNFGLAGYKPCSANEECLSDSCIGGICAVQNEGSWCSCSGSDYSTCGSSNACPPNLVCNPSTYTCVSVPVVPPLSYKYLCGLDRCYQKCYGNYTYCAPTYETCYEDPRSCTANAQCCSNNCTGMFNGVGWCAWQTDGDWCQEYRWGTGTLDWPFGISTRVTVDYCSAGFSCAWNATENGYTCSSGYTQVSNCTVLSSPHTTYELSADITGAVGTCFNITAAYVTLDGKGHSISGMSLGYGVYSNQAYTTVENMRVSGFTDGVYFSGAMGGYLSYVNSSSQNGNGIYLQSNTGTSMFNVIGNSSTLNGIYLSSSTGNSMSNGRGISSSGAGINLSSSVNNTISSMVSSSVSGKGIALMNSANNYFLNDINAVEYNDTVQRFYSNSVQNTLSHTNRGWWPLYNSAGSDAIAQASTAWYNGSAGGRNADGSTNPANDYWFGGNTAPISQCAVLASPNVAYELSADIANVSGNCFIIAAANITLNGKGHLINGTGVSDTSGVFSDQANSVVKNMRISGFTRGVYFYNNAGGNISSVNATAAAGGYGILLSSSQNNRILNSSGNSDSSAGIYIYMSSNTIITNSNGSSNTLYGILLSSSTNNQMTNSAGRSDSGYGIYLYLNSNNNSIMKSVGSSNSRYGIYLSSSSNGNQIINSTGSSNTYVGIAFHTSSNNNSIINSNGSSNTSIGIDLVSNSDIRIVNSIGSSNANTGIYLYSNSNGQIINSTGISNLYDGIQIFSSSNIQVINSNGSSNASVGIVLGTGSSGNFVMNSIGRSDSGYGIELASTLNNQIINSTGITGSLNNSHQGILLLSSSNNSIINSTGSSAGSSAFSMGIYFSGSSNNSIINSVGNSNSQWGIYIFSSSLNNYFENSINSLNYTGATQKFYSGSAQNTSSKGNKGWWPLFSSSGSDATTQANTAWYNGSAGGRNADGSANASLTYWYGGQN